MAACAVLLGLSAGELDVPARRVVSLSPVGSEVMLDLGYADRLVAVDAVSAEVPGLGGLPLAKSESVGDFAPDLILTPPSEEIAVRRAAPRAEVLLVKPHTFDEAYQLYRSIGAALGRAEEARRYVLEMSRPLGEIGASSFGKRRPRVVAVLQLEPLEIAGGHSFVTDLIEMAGGESLTHGTQQLRLAWPPEKIVQAAPELALLVSRRPPTPDEIAYARSLLGPSMRIEPLVIDPDRFWLHDAQPVVERVQAWIDAVRSR